MDPRPARLVLAAAMLCGPEVRADYDPSAYPPYETCALCHGLTGVSHSARFPHLAGQKPAYIEAQIRAFLSGARTNDGGQMASIVTELGPKDIPVVVRWFADQTPPAPHLTGDSPARTDAGARAFADLGCPACHDNTDTGAPDVPFLTAQHRGYLVKQMTDFRDGRRSNAAAPDLHADRLALPDQVIEDIAAFLAAETRP